MHLLDDHPELGTILQCLCDFRLGQELELVKERCSSLFTREGAPCQYGLEHKPNQSTAFCFLESKFLVDILAIFNACSSLDECSVQNHLEAGSPGKLESFHQGTELSDIEVKPVNVLQIINLFLAQINTCLFETNHGKDS